MWDSVGGTSIEQWMDKPALEQCGYANATNGTHWWTVDYLKGLNIGTVLWYQGENNILANMHQSRFMYYRACQEALIESWRSVLGYAPNATAIPFTLAQIAPCALGPLCSAYNHGLAMPFLREAQAEAVHNIVKAGMAVTLDLGDVDSSTHGPQTHPSKHHGGKSATMPWKNACIWG